MSMRWVAWAPAALAGCSSSGAGASSDAARTQPCTITYSGAFTGSADCTDKVFGPSFDGSGSNGLTWAVDVDPFLGGVEVSTTSALTDGPYTQTSAVSASIVYDQDYIAALDVGGVPDQGAFSLTFSSQGTMTTLTDGNAIWTGAHGAFTATLAPHAGSDGSGSGELMVAVSF